MAQGSNKGHRQCCAVSMNILGCLPQKKPLHWSIQSDFWINFYLACFHCPPTRLPHTLHSSLSTSLHAVGFSAFFYILGSSFYCFPFSDEHRITFCLTRLSKVSLTVALSLPLSKLLTFDSSICLSLALLLLLFIFCYFFY